MSITKFGEYMRIFRIKKNIIMEDTSDKLNVKTPFLSAVENGKKNYLLTGLKNIYNSPITYWWVEKLMKTIEDFADSVKLIFWIAMNCKKFSPSISTFF